MDMLAKPQQWKRFSQKSQIASLKRWKAFANFIDLDLLLHFGGELENQEPMILQGSVRPLENGHCTYF